MKYIMVTFYLPRSSSLANSNVSMSVLSSTCIRKLNGGTDGFQSSIDRVPVTAADNKCA